MAYQQQPNQQFLWSIFQKYVKYGLIIPEYDNYLCYRVDKDHSGAISATELESALSNGMKCCQVLCRASVSVVENVYCLLLRLMDNIQPRNGSSDDRHV